MKICIIADEIYTSGGKQRVVCKIANMLSKNHDVSIAFTDKKAKINNDFYALDSKITKIYSKCFYSSKICLKPFSLLRKINIIFLKIMGVHLFKSVFFPYIEVKAYEKFLNDNLYDVVIGVAARNSALLALTNCSAIKIGWFHNTYEAYFQTRGRSCYMQEDLYKSILPNLNEIIVLTDRDQKVYSKHFRAKFIRIYNPVCINNDMSREYKKNRSLLFVGRLVYEQKGLGLLIDILKTLNKMNSNYKLQIVGKGPDEKRFFDELVKENLSENIEFIGETKDVESFYKHAKILVLPSKYEGFGLVVAEALSFGLPVISFATEGPSEILVDGECGYLIDKYNTVKFAEKIALILSNDEVRENMSKNAKKRAQEFSENEIEEQWNKFLEQY